MDRDDKTKIAGELTKLAKSLVSRPRDPDKVIDVANTGDRAVIAIESKMEALVGAMKILSQEITWHNKGIGNSTDVWVAVDDSEKAYKVVKEALNDLPDAWNKVFKKLRGQ